MLSADSPDYFQGKAEGGFIGGFDKRSEGFFQFLMAFLMPEIKHLPHFSLR
jgi:hypothetical protein